MSPAVHPSAYRSVVVGVDGGGSKTIAAVATLEGEVLGIGRTGPANFQVVGRAGAAAALGGAAAEALRAAGRTAADVVALAVGTTGADRAADFDIVRRFLDPVVPRRPYTLVNDTEVALRAGSTDGTGVALIAGAGANCIGRNAAGVRAAVGGLGPLSGDVGFAEDIAAKAVARAMAGEDGRAPPTPFGERLKAVFGIARVEDLAERFYADTFDPIDMASLAPLVFEAIRAGDEACAAIVRDAGETIGRNAVVCLAKLGFRPPDAPTVVFGGSVFTRAEPALMAESTSAVVRAHFPAARFVRLRVEPLAGALLYALDASFGGLTPAGLRARLLAEPALQL